MNGDASARLCAEVQRAHEQRRPLRITGGDTKHWYGCKNDGEVLSIAEHRGIVQYDPTELVITARAGTPIAEIEAALREQRQMLAFEPPLFGAASTLGGVVASGISGPRRPFAGAIRDFILGAKILDGRGQVLRFGGVVFKNVAGFDVSRLMAGSLGCLGVLLEVSLRVMPEPAYERATHLDVTFEASQMLLNDLQRRPSPLSAACFDARGLHLRFSGGEAAVRDAVRAVGGAEESLTFWPNVRHFRHEFFSTDERIWRISLPSHAAQLPLSGHWLWDWAGAQRWLTTAAPAKEVRRLAAGAGGHATLFRGAMSHEEVFAQPSRPVLELHRRLKAAFDPANILNSGRMYPGL